MRRVPNRGLGPLVGSRLVDQAVLGAASLALAARLGPERYDVVAVLFLVASLGVQLSDFGVGLAVMASGRTRRLSSHALRNMRLLDAAVLAVAASVASVTGQLVVLVVGLLWSATAEAYVRRAVCMVNGTVRRVATAEAVAAVLAAGAFGVAFGLRSVEIAGLALVIRYVTEAALVGSASPGFERSGRRLGLPWEWVGQAVNFAAANIDYVLIAATLGGATLSVYSIGFRVASGIPALTAVPITQRALVDLAACGSGPGRAEAVGAVIRRAFIVGCGGALLVLAAAPVLPLVLGTEWGRTAGVAAVLAAAVPSRMLIGPVVATLLAEGRRTSVIRIEVLRLLLTAGAVAVAVAAGVGVVQISAAVVAATGAGVALSSLVAARITGYQELCGPALIAATIALLGAAGTWVVA